MILGWLQLLQLLGPDLSENFRTAKLAFVRVSNQMVSPRFASVQDVNLCWLRPFARLADQPEGRPRRERSPYHLQNIQREEKGERDRETHAAQWDLE